VHARAWERTWKWAHVTPRCSTVRQAMRSTSATHTRRWRAPDRAALSSGTSYRTGTRRNGRGVARRFRRWLRDRVAPRCSDRTRALPEGLAPDVDHRRLRRSGCVLSSPWGQQRALRSRMGLAASTIERAQGELRHHDEAVPRGTRSRTGTAQRQPRRVRRPFGDPHREPVNSESVWHPDSANRPQRESSHSRARRRSHCSVCQRRTSRAQA
jgi:hypothetical protein